MTQQLRIYSLNPKLKQEFLDRFKIYAMPIMQSYGIKVGTIWLSETSEKLEFVYVIEAEDEAVLLAKLDKFLADEKWIAIKNRTRQRYGEMVLAKEERILEEVSLE